MNQRFAIHLISFGILATAFVVLCGASFAQQSDTPRFPERSSCPLRAGRRVAAPFKRSSLRVETVAVPASTPSTAPYKCRVLIKEARPIRMHRKVRLP